jgi:hypothetical protein
MVERSLNRHFVIPIEHDHDLTIFDLCPTYLHTGLRDAFQRE